MVGYFLFAVPSKEGTAKSYTSLRRHPTDDSDAVYYPVVNEWGYKPLICFPSPGHENIPMKIAVCFVGVTRNYSKHTLDSIEKNLFDVVAARDPHFKRFAHFNRLEVLTNER